jgi:hypothetical protein
MISLRTHLPLWHASPREALPAIEEGGIALMREYVWCSLHPLMPIRLFQQFTPDFILSAIALPRAGEEGFLWEEIRGAPGGDAEERTYDHGGGGIEVKVWTALPRACIREIIPRQEVEARLGRGGASGYGEWLPAAADFAQECGELLADPRTEPQVRVQAGLYLREMGRLCAGGKAGERRAALLEVLASAEALVDDALAVCTRLLDGFGLPWLEELPLRTELSAERLARIAAFASTSHSEGQLRAFGERCAPGSGIGLLGERLCRLAAAGGRDEEAIPALARTGSLGAGALKALLLGSVRSNPVAVALVRALEGMLPEVGNPALLGLLRRRRDLPTKARKALALALERRAAQLEPQLREVAECGRYHARLVARQILEGRAGNSAPGPL